VEKTSSPDGTAIAYDVWGGFHSVPTRLLAPMLTDFFTP